MAEIEIRLCRASDLDALHAINEASTPGVGSAPKARWPDLVAMCDLVLVAERDGAPAGLIMVMVEGCDYDSLNYAWVSERYDRFAYVDRIAIAPNARSDGLGRRLYEAAFDRLRGRRQILLCEVNLEPPNPGSQRFHASLGFEPVGERWLPDRTKGVVYLRRKI